MTQKTINVCYTEILCEVFMFKKILKFLKIILGRNCHNQIFYIANGTEILPEKLSAKEEFDLVNVMKSGNSEAKNQLIERNLRLVVYTAQKFENTNVNIEDLTLDQLQNYHLEGTTETIPTFRQVLNLYNGQAPLIIELKAANGNAAKLAEAVCNALKTYHGPYGIESFDPRCLLWLKRNRPDVIRGQLSQNFMKNPSGQGRLIDFILTFLLGNLLTKPDFIAYKFEDRKNLSNLLCLYLWRMQGASWTITKQENFETCVQEGLLPIFEQFEPKVFFEE